MVQSNTNEIRYSHHRNSGYVTFKTSDSLTLNVHVGVRVTSGFWYLKQMKLQPCVFVLLQYYRGTTTSNAGLTVSRLYLSLNHMSLMTLHEAMFSRFPPIYTFVRVGGKT